MAGAVERHGLEDHPTRHTPRNPSLEHLCRAEMANCTPRHAAQSGVGIAVLPVGRTTEREPLERKAPLDIVPDPRKPLELTARPRDSQHLVERTSEIILHLVINLPVEQLMRDGLG